MTAQNKRPRGRTPGWSPGETRVMTHQVAEWTWNHDKLLSKLVKGQHLDDCWQWLGSQGPQGNLFGAYKRKESGEYQAQMTQANRLMAMAETGEDLTGQCVFMRCGNRHCSNPRHFVIQPKKGADKRGIYV